MFIVIKPFYKKGEGEAFTEFVLHEVVDFIGVLLWCTVSILYVIYMYECVHNDICVDSIDVEYVILEYEYPTKKKEFCNCFPLLFGRHVEGTWRNFIAT